MISIRRKFTFEAAHFLPEHNGKCKNLHGHSYKLFVTVSKHGDFSKDGMIIDFSDLKKIVENEVIYQLDHSDLNRIIKIPTAENLILWIAERLKSIFFMHNLIVKKLELYETENCCAIWEAE